MKRVFKTLLSAGLIAAATTAASAHRIWILPSTFTLSGEQEWVTVDGAISNDLFFPNHVAMNLANVTVTAPDGSAVPLENGARGKFRSTFDVKLDQQGTYKIAENAATYFAQWQEDGERRRTRDSLAGLVEKGIVKKEGVELTVAQRRVETFVTLGAPTRGVFDLAPEGMAMAPITHPNDVYEGEDVSFQLLLDGKPAAGIEVTVVKGNDRYRDTSGEVKVKTDEEGQFTFTAGEPGRYWMQGHTMAGSATVEGYEMDRRVSYTATFEVLQN